MYDHHAIVQDVDHDKETLILTEFDSSKEGWRKSKIVTNKRSFAEVKHCLYKVVYALGEALEEGKYSFKIDQLSS